MPNKRTIEMVSILDDYAFNHIRTCLTIEGGVLLNVMCQYETLIDEEWRAVVRYDCAHGFFHRDMLYPNGDEEKQALDVDNLKMAASYARQDLNHRWKFYLERYMRKIKK